MSLWQPQPLFYYSKFHRIYFKKKLYHFWWNILINIDLQFKFYLEEYGLIRSGMHIKMEYCPFSFIYIDCDKLTNKMRGTYLKSFQFWENLPAHISCGQIYEEKQSVLNCFDCTSNLSLKGFFSLSWLFLNWSSLFVIIVFL